MGRRAGELERVGRFDEAEAVVREVLTIRPDNPAARYALGVLLLRRGDYVRGWDYYEARRELAGATPAPPLSFPEWKGEQVTSLFVAPEQGLGDMIQFARYLPELVARGIKVTLGAPPSLVRLLSGLGAEIIPWSGEIAVPRHDAWVFACSLPRFVTTIPTAPYLPGSTAGSGLGVVVRGNPKHPGDAKRSLSEPYASSVLAMGRELSPDATGARDFEDTAEIIRGLEAVVSVDTSVAHLAGAMGKRTYLLLPHLPDWRWGVSGERSIWYPSMRLLRQTTPGDWSGPLYVLARMTSAAPPAAAPPAEVAPPLPPP